MGSGKHVVLSVLVKLYKKSVARSYLRNKGHGAWTEGVRSCFLRRYIESIGDISNPADGAPFTGPSPNHPPI